MPPPAHLGRCAVPRSSPPHRRTPARAAAKPIPVLPPVTSAVRPARWPSSDACAICRSLSRDTCRSCPDPRGALLRKTLSAAPITSCVMTARQTLAMQTARDRVGAAQTSDGATMVEVRDELFIGGSLRRAHSTERLPVINPATEEHFASIVDADEVDVDRAVRTADDAFRSAQWRAVTPPERAGMLRRLADIIESRAAELGRLVTTQNGMVLANAVFGSGPPPPAITATSPTSPTDSRSSRSAARSARALSSGASRSASPRWSCRGTARRVPSRGSSGQHWPRAAQPW